MSLAKQGTRVVEADGQRYRWRVHTARDPYLAIVVELAEDAAQRAVIWIHPPGTIITPRLAGAAIRHALTNGWTPARRGPELTLRFDGTASDAPLAFIAVVRVREPAPVAASGSVST